MPTEVSYRLMRYRLVESIVPLAAFAEELVEYAHANTSAIDEPVRDFVDWTYESVPGMVAAALLPGDLPTHLGVLHDQAIAAIDSAPDEPCESAVLHRGWSEMRTTANAVLDRFRDLGIPIPSIESGLLGDISTVPPSQR